MKQLVIKKYIVICLYFLLYCLYLYMFLYFANTSSSQVIGPTGLLQSHYTYGYYNGLPSHYYPIITQREIYYHLFLPIDYLKSQLKYTNSLVNYDSFLYIIIGVVPLFFVSLLRNKTNNESNKNIFILSHFWYSIISFFLLCFIHFEICCIWIYSCATMPPPQ